MTVGEQSVELTHGADIAQAAYFRAELLAERQLLLRGIRKRQALIERPTDTGRARVRLTRTEVQLRHIDWLIAKLDSRFADRG